MDPVTGIGLAAAIVQLIEVSTKITKRLVEFSSADLENEPPKSFKKIINVLPLITEGLRSLQSNVDHISPHAKDSLRAVVQDCLKDVFELNNILDKVLPSTKASSWEKTKKAVASLKHEKDVEEISQGIDRSIKALNFYQITKISQNGQVEQPSPTERTYWIVPFDRNPSFVDRSAVFDEIEKAFKVDEGVQPKAALHGLGGIGKSQIALEYCYRRRKEDPRCSIFWCNAATIARFEQSLGRIASECGLVPGTKTETDVPEVVTHWLESHIKGKWLMVIDNVDDTDVFFEGKTRSGKTMSECIPHCAGGSLLVTTRSRETAFDVLKQTRPITIKQMDKEEGSKLARKRLPEDTPEDQVLQLLKTLEFIPLAITQASSFIAKRGKTVQYYLEQYQKNDTIRTKLLSYEFSDHGRQGSSMESLAKTWIISFEVIRESNPRAAELLCLMSFFQHHGIPAILLRREQDDEFDFDDAVAVLESFSFVDVDESHSGFKMHRLVQLATKWWLQTEGYTEWEKWALEALKSVVARFPYHGPLSSPDGKLLSVGAILLPHAELVLQNNFRQFSSEVDLLRARLFSSTGCYFRWEGFLNEARFRFEQSINLNSKHLGEQHIDTMNSTIFAANIASGLRDPAAITMLERLLELQESVLGEDDPGTIDTLHELAKASYRVTRDFQRSEILCREALTRSRRALSMTNEITLSCMTVLARILSYQGRIAEAGTIQRECYATAIEVFGPSSHRALIARDNLAYTLSYCEETYGESYELFTENLEKGRNNLGHDDPERLAYSWSFARLLKRMKRVEELRRLCKQLLQEIETGGRSTSDHVQGIKSDLEELLRSVESEP
ncbi:hypothetical protein FSARC_13793 [Fusarium sarcochroum]|uniref:NACHT-NTPase and P-loop NTPases N-terminal domain-containing protein n=1 Tax=Fusarium sarcochroum TaxID=1208366 RepID=A0A8H4SYT9_9HYPO|nr:hypothetical protein FSARC_13793 [Fusarium sarcochroum]